MSDRGRITVLEIESRAFPRRMRGYDPTAVQLFLQEIAADYDDLQEENRRLKSELGSASTETDKFRSMEDTLKEALMLAQKSADEVRANARKEAELILAEAKLQAAKLEEEIAGLKAQKRLIISEIRALLRTHLDALPSDVHAAVQIEAEEPVAQSH
ncbi:MAG: DivIVA domain-containing protein [Armatimonadetes bacterium]|nr:DivIVA domain-containing protein [Armatimonadota bacterium]